MEVENPILVSETPIDTIEIKNKVALMEPQSNDTSKGTSIEIELNNKKNPEISNYQTSFNGFHFFSWNQLSNLGKPQPDYFSLALTSYSNSVGDFAKSNVPHFSVSLHQMKNKRC